MNKELIKEHILKLLNDTEKLFSFFVLTSLNFLSFFAALIELVKGIWSGKLVMIEVEDFPVKQIPLYLIILLLSVTASMFIIYFNKLVSIWLKRYGKK